MSMQQLKPDSPLVPFIVFFAFVILLTIMIANSKSGSSSTQNAQGKSANAPKPELSLSHSSTAKLLDAKTRKDAQRPFDSSGVPDLGALLAGANADLERGANRDAEEKLRTALVFDPANPRILSQLGILMLQSGRNQDAELFLRALAEAAPNDAIGLNNLATALARQRKYVEAARCVERVLQINPDSDSAFITLAGLHSLSGNVLAAIENFKRAYDKLGSRILLFANNPSFDNLRGNPDFKAILEKAAAQQSQERQAKEDAEALERNEPPQ